MVKNNTYNLGITVKDKVDDHNNDFKKVKVVQDIIKDN